jgi:hypothetical protein
MQRVETIPAVTETNGLADLYERHAPAAGRLAYLLTGDVASARHDLQLLVDVGIGIGAW